MALITRVSRLFQADLHAVLDRIEEPDVLLRQAVREMEEELAQGEQRLKLLKHEQGQLSARESEFENSLVEIEQELDICFDAGKEDLARTMIRRKLEAQRLSKDLSHKRKCLIETASGLEAQLKENHMHLDSMRQKAELLTEERVPESADINWMTKTFTVRDEDVEVAFLREKQKRRAS